MLISPFWLSWALRPKGGGVMGERYVWEKFNVENRIEYVLGSQYNSYSGRYEELARYSASELQDIFGTAAIDKDTGDILLVNIVDTPEFSYEVHTALNTVAPAVKIGTVLYQTDQLEIIYQASSSGAYWLIRTNSQSRYSYSYIARGDQCQRQGEYILWQSLRRRLREYPVNGAGG